MRFLVAAILLMHVSLISAKRPHILFIVADDLGWNDVGFRNPDMFTPNIDKIAHQGVIFESAYVLPVCSPSRSTFMSGMYPYHTGLQHIVIGDQKVCLPLHLRTLPQQLKEVGYATHAVGKWHLGFCNWNCTPTYRGFDSYLGYYHSQEDYYSHVQGGYLDFNDGERVAREFNGQYSTYVYTNRTTNIIEAHDPDVPLFMYLPYQNVHYPIQVPEKYSNMYPHVFNEGRKKFSGMVSALDEAFGNITNALFNKGMLDNTLILFTTDNGAEVFMYGDNYPLRGGKHTLWEGGTRGTSFMAGAGITQPGIHYNGLIHSVDWMPTLLGAAGAPQLPGLDGVNQWDSIRLNQQSKRTEFIYNLDDFPIPTQGHAGIRVGDWKLLLGYPGQTDGWTKPMNQTKDTLLLNNIYFAGDTPTYLFNIADDPNEYNNMADKRPDIVGKLTARINEYRLTYVAANYPPPDPQAREVAKKNGNAWAPGWC
ncbi:arylsulfatase B [Patella vulgata]|uniref:arylsulfatase B n=1 Tax=Patella vulgata TaxID=6465 RepID=UPI00217FCDC1|nr:arylsulfatase B [Patella vulgata]XP_050412434.1 arylsulfatase B [Patella vulgata]XP_050412435.1 arylsulfatase B [Patella vulgata]